MACLQSQRLHNQRHQDMTQSVTPTHTCCRSFGSCTPLRCSCCGGSSRARRPGAAEAGSGRCSTAMLSTASDKGSHAFGTDLSTVRASGCISMRSVICTVASQLFPRPKHVILIHIHHPYTGNVNSDMSGDIQSAFLHCKQVFGDS